MARHKKLNSKNHKIQIRLTQYEFNRIRWLADKYEKGNMSALMIRGALTASPKRSQVKA